MHRHLEMYIFFLTLEITNIAGLISFLEQWTAMAASSKRIGNLSSTFEKDDSIIAPPVHGKNKQITLLSQCNLAFTGRNVLMALKIRRDINKI
jgi:hypothetical protein